MKSRREGKRRGEKKIVALRGDGRGGVQRGRVRVLVRRRPCRGADSRNGVKKGTVVTLQYRFGLQLLDAVQASVTRATHQHRTQAAGKEGRMARGRRKMEAKSGVGIRCHAVIDVQIMTGTKGWSITGVMVG